MSCLILILIRAVANSLFYFQFHIYMWITLHPLQNEWRKDDQNEMRHSKVKSKIKIDKQKKDNKKDRR